MPDRSDIVDALRGLGIRTPVDVLRALIAHLTKSRASPVQVLEHLVAVERRERDARNLERRTKSATLGTVPPLDRFDWNHPRQIDRPLYESLFELGFLKLRERREPEGLGEAHEVNEGMYGYQR